MPAVWTTPDTWAAGQMVTADDLNEQVRDNLLWLLNRSSALYNVDKASNYTTTSTTFVAVDSGSLNLTIDVKSGIAEVHFHGFVVHPSGGADARAYFDVAVDGVRTAGDDGITCSYNTNITLGFPISFTRRIPSLTPGSHTFQLQWKTTAGITATLYAGAGTAGLDLHPQFWVKDAG